MTSLCPQAAVSSITYAHALASYPSEQKRIMQLVGIKDLTLTDENASSAVQPVRRSSSFQRLW